MRLRIADDFGLGRRHDQVILSLIEAGRLDGTSVMVNDAIEPGALARLQALRQAGAKVGLHLNLTQPFVGGTQTWPLATLMQPLPGKRLLDAAAASFDRQAREFVSLFGSGPDFYDGHQHCHCFPAIAPLVTRLPREPASWVRVPLPAAWRERMLNLAAGGPKVVLVMALAARARAIFSAAGLSVNRDFSGFLRLDDPASVRKWLPRLLAAAGEECLLMLHPGDAYDPVQCPGHAPESRAAETEILRESALR
ncbi:MAG: ChbG/HpnK family deacetylase [Mesorhizobium sp.]